MKTCAIFVFTPVSAKKFASVKLLTGKVLCQSDSVEVAESITRSLRWVTPGHYRTWHKILRCLRLFWREIVREFGNDDSFTVTLKTYRGSSIAHHVPGSYPHSSLNDPRDHRSSSERFHAIPRRVVLKNLKTQRLLLSFDYIVMRWMAVAQVRYNKQNSQFYCAAFREYVRKTTKTSTSLF